MTSQECLNIVSNPFIKAGNRNWELEEPERKNRSTRISPPSPGAVKRKPHHESQAAATSQPVNHESSDSLEAVAEKPKAVEKTPQTGKEAGAGPITVDAAAVEAGEVQIRNHLDYFTTQLSKYARSSPIPNQPILPISEFTELYQRNQHPNGRHYVIHQHDHPVAGVHYDLRLQINETSSISFAIMYGVPGNVNSRRLNRNATETRVHNLWNHLIETASQSTGSLLIWDTGEYEILPRRSKYAPEIDPDSASSSSDSDASASSCRRSTSLSEPEKLAAAFQNRKIRLRLHGTKLPKNYTLNLRLTKAENRTEQPKKPVRKRKRVVGGIKGRKKAMEETPPASDEEAEDDETVVSRPVVAKDSTAPGDGDGVGETSAMEKELQEQEDEEVRLTNAYPGATNSIGSIHQRKWYLSVDRAASGFIRCRKRGRVVWERAKGDDGTMEGFENFFVKGRDVERSVVTGRNADEIMSDEGVVGYIGRKGWRAVME